MYSSEPVNSKKYRLIILRFPHFTDTFLGYFCLLDPDPHSPCGSGSRRSPIMRIQIGSASSTPIRIPKVSHNAAPNLQYINGRSSVRRTYFDGVDNPGALLCDRVEVDGAVCGQDNQLILPGCAGMKGHLLHAHLVFQPTHRKPTNQQLCRTNIAVNWQAVMRTTRPELVNKILKSLSKCKF